MNLPSDEVCQRLTELHRLLGQSADHLDPLLELLAEHGMSWSDWPEFFNRRKALPSGQPAKLRNTVRGIHELIGRASTRAQQLSARNKLIQFLGQRSLDWATDLPPVLAEEWCDPSPTAANPTSASASDLAEDVSALDVQIRVISDRVVLTKTECLVAALWDLSTYVYIRFPYAPQLGVVAPASSRGKSILRRLLQGTACNAWHAHRISPASLPRKLVRELEHDARTVVMLDEGENQNFLRDERMCGIIDAIYESDGLATITGKDGEPVDFPAFASLLWAVRGSINDVPMSVLSRGFQIVMEKGRPQKRLPKDYMEEPDLVGARNLNEAWSAKVQLDLDPEMPPELCRDPRLEDNCRILISIADSFGVGAEARAALIKFCANLLSSDVGILALEDARKVWASKAEHLFILSNWTGQRRQVPPAFDRICARALVAGMVDVNPFWSSWRGVNDKGGPGPLTPGQLGALLARFKIYISTVWPRRRKPGDKSVGGYYLAAFERAWAENLDEDPTATQPNKIIELLSHKRTTHRP
jgi:hypothetical protein